MKKILLLLMLLFPILGFSQFTTLTPDTVCYQTGGSIYNVPNTPGLSYTWVVSAPAILNSGQLTNQISVDWSNAAPGLIPNGISVTATDINGCQSLPVSLNIFIYNEIININPVSDMCETSPCVNLTATPLGGVWSGTGVSGSQFCPQVSGDGQFNITYTVTNAGCTFTDVITINVIPQPILGPINHN